MPLDDPLATNPLLAAWPDTFGLPPFAALRPDHFAPALQEAMRRHRAELEEIANQHQPPSFDNTAAAFDRAGALLYRLEAVLSNLTASETSPALQAVQREMAAPLAAHDSAVKMHAGLFQRLNALYLERERADWTPEQRRLVERLHTDFVRAGAQLPPEVQRHYAQNMQAQAELTTRFAQNVLADESGYQLQLQGEEDLAAARVPAGCRGPGRCRAQPARGQPGDHVEPVAGGALFDFLRTARPA